MKQSEVLLVLADISGYTKFLLANKETISQTHEVIIELLKAIIHHFEIPLKFCKLEGDAVFFYAVRENDEEWEHTLEVFGIKVLELFNLFRYRLNELRESEICSGEACRLIEKLQLKLIIHKGKADIFRFDNTIDLAGLDVIIAHRLLKNSLPFKEYILLTRQALEEIRFPRIVCMQNFIECYDDIGEIECFCCEAEKNTDLSGQQ